EEVEVALDVPAPQVDEDRRGSDQAEGRRGGAQRARAERQGRGDRGGRDHAALEGAVSQALAGGEREGRDPDCLEPKEEENAGVAPEPGLVGELGAPWDGRPQGPAEAGEEHDAQFLQIPYQPRIAL